MKDAGELATINIGNINEGAMIDGFDLELRKALENIADLTTPATATRTVTLHLTLKPHSDRVVIETEFRCASKLAGIETHKSKIFLGRRRRGRARCVRCRSAANAVMEPAEAYKGFGADRISDKHVKHRKDRGA